MEGGPSGWAHHTGFVAAGAFGARRSCNARSPLRERRGLGRHGAPHAWSSRQALQLVVLVVLEQVLVLLQLVEPASTTSLASE